MPVKWWAHIQAEQRARERLEAQEARARQIYPTQSNVRSTQWP